MYGHTVEIMGQVAKDSARTSRKALSCGVLLRGSGLALIIAATVEKMGARIGSLGDSLWGITYFSYKGLSERGPRKEGA